MTMTKRVHIEDIDCSDLDGCMTKAIEQLISLRDKYAKTHTDVTIEHGMGWSGNPYRPIEEGIEFPVFSVFGVKRDEQKP